VKNIEIKKLGKIFNPKSIAVVGASNNPRKVGYAVFKNLLTYPGKIFPINKKRKKIFNKQAYPSILDIEGEIDLVVVTTKADTVFSIVKECCKKKVKGIVIMSSGFNETGREGEIICDDILKLTKKNEIRVMGPNCMGFINPYIDLNVSFTNTKLKKGNIAFISQSGALGSSTIDWALDNGLSFSFFASLGSMIDISFNDLIDYLSKDKKTEGVMIYMESLNNAPKFISAAKKFLKNKPLFVLKSGKSNEGAKASKSHTGGLAGNDEIFNAAFSEAGILRVDETVDLLNCAKIFSKQKILTGNKLAIITNAGGPGVLSTDTLVNLGGEVAKLSKNSFKILEKILPNNWSHGNPIDLLGDAEAKDYKNSIEICLKDKNVDGILVLLTPQTMTNSISIAKSIISIKKDKPILVSFMGGPSVQKGKEILEKGDIPTFPYPEMAVKSFMHLFEYGSIKKSQNLVSGQPIKGFNPLSFKTRKIINEAIKKKIFLLNGNQSNKILLNYGIPVVPQGLAKNAQEAVEIAQKIGYPIAMKISSSEIFHKTELNAVKLDINSKEEIKKEYSKIIDSVLTHNSKFSVEGVIIQKMIHKKYELILGCKKDPIFGSVIVFGGGGISVNLFKDTQIGFPPLNSHSAKSLINKTKISKLLNGYRNTKGVDMDFLISILCKFSRLIEDFPEIEEIDINPFSIDEQGGMAVDTKIILDKNYLNPMPK